MIKYTLLALALLAPITSVAKSPTMKPIAGQDAPMPMCYPCTKTPLTLNPIQHDAPMPECYPCKK